MIKSLQWVGEPGCPFFHSGFVIFTDSPNFRLARESLNLLGSVVRVDIYSMYTLYCIQLIFLVTSKHELCYIQGNKLKT